MATGFATDGSVGISRGALGELLCWLDPELHTVVVMAPERVITQY